MDVKLQLLIPLCLSGRCPHNLGLKNEYLLGSQSLQDVTRSLEALAAQTDSLGRGAAQGFVRNIMYYRGTASDRDTGSLYCTHLGGHVNVDSLSIAIPHSEGLPKAFR